MQKYNTMTLPYTIRQKISFSHHKAFVANRQQATDAFKAILES
jgi:hypothetical protein